jgi:hypothetical protein
MALNLHRCDAPGCPSTAVSSGGGIGLRALGWYFRIGPTAYCPFHRPDGIPCREERPEERIEGPCSQCRAKEDSDRATALLTTDEDRAALESLRGLPHVSTVTLPV